MTTFDTEQITIGRTILAAVQSLGLSPADTQRAQLTAIETALAESEMRNVTYGDRPASMGGAMSSSRGVFQQIAAWGPLEDRQNVFKATWMFLNGGQAGQRGLLDVPGWNTMETWHAAQAVQGSEFDNGSNYLDRYQPALEFIKAHGGGVGALSAADRAALAASPGGVVGSDSGVQTVGTSTGGTQNVSSGGGGIFSGVQSMVITFALKVVFTMTGLGMVLLGTWRMSAPVRRGAAKVAAVAR